MKRAEFMLDFKVVCKCGYVYVWGTSSIKKFEANFFGEKVVLMDYYSKN